MTNEKKETDREQKSAAANDSMLMEELAEDMLHVIEAQSSLNTRLNALEEQMSHISNSMEHYFKSSYQEIDKIRNDLISERKAFIGSSTFNALLPAIESIRLSMDNLNREGDVRLAKQLSGVSDLLRMVLQSIGYKAFDVKAGEEYNSIRMECVGWEPGDPGIVIRMERQGFMAGEQIAKPAQVIIGAEE